MKTLVEKFTEQMKALSEAKDRNFGSNPADMQEMFEDVLADDNFAGKLMLLYVKRIMGSMGDFIESMDAIVKDIIGVDPQKVNPNSTAQLLPWLTARGYPYTSLSKELVKKALSEDPDMEDVDLDD